MLPAAFISDEAGKAQMEKNAPRVAFAVFLLVIDFDPSTADFQFVESTPWLSGGIEYRLGVDGISILFILLTAFLTPLCILSSEFYLDRFAVFKLYRAVFKCPAA